MKAMVPVVGCSNRMNNITGANPAEDLIIIWELYID